MVFLRRPTNVLFFLHFSVERHRRPMNLFDRSPVVDKDAYVAPSASVIGYWGMFSLKFYGMLVDHGGHNAVIHGCDEDEAFVGMGATLLDGVVVEKTAMVAAGTLVR
ncbi:Gamma carbonic anhydrase 2, mitochondrial [Sesamum angolense]|uniref:Gamma carbonic anhydrase 2, mitochondrial n=1 Tax=Sesamum angolense TaxID=2727404 RepID=A0AAE1W6Y0_9LAMI|nr:Gamma carbonic anhydrase 2, mitochondrial [Sesamum angolense]